MTRESRFSLTGPWQDSKPPMTQIASGEQFVVVRERWIRTRPASNHLKLMFGRLMPPIVPFGVLRTRVATACAGRQWCLG